MDKNVEKTSAYNKYENLYTHENGAERKIVSKNNFAEHMKIHADGYSGQIQSNTIENDDNMCILKKNKYFSIKKSLNVENVSSVTTNINQEEIYNYNVIYQCNICVQSSLNLHSFALHMITHVECSMHECVVCDQKFATIVLWVKHLNDHQDQVPSKFLNSQIQSPVVEANTNITTNSVKMKHEVHMSTCKNTTNNLSIVTGFKEPSVSNITPDKNSFSCNVCKNVFLSEKELIKHKYVHRKPKSFSCKYCDKTFFKKWSLSQHENEHINDENKNTVKDHQSIENQSNIQLNSKIDDPTLAVKKKKLSSNYSEKNITKPFTSHMQLRQRTNTKYFEEQVDESSDSNNEVDLPNKKGQNFKDRNEECPQEKNTTIIGLYQPLTQYSCENCKEGFYSIYQLRKHLTFNKKCYDFLINSNIYKLVKNGGNNSIKPFECYTCKKTFLNRNNCIRHLKKIHNVVNKYDLNNYSIPKYIELKKLNPKTVQQNSKFQNRNKGRMMSQSYINKCKDCGKSYSNSSNLHRHKVMNHKMNTFYCTICNKTLQHKYSLAEHMRVKHRQLSPNIKTIDAKQIGQDIKSISQISDLALYLCKVCKMEFADNNSLQNHIKVHTLNMYECKDCCKLFETNIALAQHILNDHNS